MNNKLVITWVIVFCIVFVGAAMEDEYTGHTYVFLTVAAIWVVIGGITTLYRIWFVEGRIK